MSWKRRSARSGAPAQGPARPAGGSARAAHRRSSGAQTPLGGAGKGACAMMIRGWLGVAEGGDPLRAIEEAAAAARRAGGDQLPKAALILVAGGAGVPGLGEGA